MLDAVRNGIPAAPTVAVAVLLLAEGVVHADLPGIVGIDEAEGGCAQIGRGGHVGGLAEHHVQGVLAEHLVISQGVFHLIAVVAVHALGSGGTVVDLVDGRSFSVLVIHGRGSDRIQAVALGGQEILLGVAVTIHIGEVQGDGVAELQAVDELELGGQAPPTILSVLL